jgi:predicted phage tail protein
MTTIRISWDAVLGASKYEVFWSQNGGSFSSTGVVTSTSKDITSPPPGVHSFKVRALNLAGTSPDSDIVSTPNTPSAPTGVTVVVIES